MAFGATWTLISYKVVYDVAGGTAIQDGLYNIETGISSLPTPKREGYVFNGWYRDNQKVTSIPAGTGDITLWRIGRRFLIRFPLRRTTTLL